MLVALVPTVVALLLGAPRAGPARRADRGARPLVDSFALRLTDNDGVPPPGPPIKASFAAMWQGWLEDVDYLVLVVPLSSYIPWTPSFMAWFDSSYELVASGDRVNVYRRRRP